MRNEISRRGWLFLAAASLASAKPSRLLIDSWDNSYISYSLHKYPKLFVAHGLLDPLGPDPAGRLRYWAKAHGFQGMRFSPIYSPSATWLNSKVPMNKEFEFVDKALDFYIPENRELILGKNALPIWKFPKG